jgi:glutathione peroxidase
MRAMSELNQFCARSLRGEEISLSRYAGKVLLVVNTASKCGFTPQYAGLEALQRKYADQGLVILGFPCNQFGKQEPGDADVIENSCLINYGVSFPMFDKIEVNGAHAHPLFNWLTLRQPGWFGRKIKWNFTKFLIGRDGEPVRRFAPITRPKKLEPAILQALGVKQP